MDFKQPDYGGSQIKLNCSTCNKSYAHSPFTPTQISETAGDQKLLFIRSDIKDGIIGEGIALGIPQLINYVDEVDCIGCEDICQSNRGSDCLWKTLRGAGACFCLRVQII